MKVSIKEKIYNGRVILKNQVVELGLMTFITGISGSGKTTLLKQLMTQYDCGYVSQDPDNQLVCDKVWHEMAFGLENMSVDPKLIRSRVAEVTTYLGLDQVFNKDVQELSGGQKQKVCLASVLCMAPDLILLDEPTAMLDPIASREFWSMVLRLNRDNGIKFVIVEHDAYISQYCDKKYELIDGIMIPYLYKVSEVEGKDIVEGKVWKTVLSIRKEYAGNLVLNISNFKLVEGINCVVGPNGIGKSTLLRYIAGGFGEKKAIEGSVMMPQDVKMIFSRENVEEELQGRVPEQLEDLRLAHPLDLSGGEQHILGVYMTLMRRADLYCFDEPTKGMDTDTKIKIMDILKESGKNILMVSHDLDLVARYANKIMFLFNREIVSEGTPRRVFESNLFYKPEHVVWK